MIPSINYRHQEIWRLLKAPALDQSLGFGPEFRATSIGRAAGGAERMP
jgi:hypothetical protein